MDFMLAAQIFLVSVSFICLGVTAALLVYLIIGDQ